MGDVCCFVKKLKMQNKKRNLSCTKQHKLFTGQTMFVMFERVKAP